MSMTTFYSVSFFGKSCQLFKSTIDKRKNHYVSTQLFSTEDINEMNTFIELLQAKNSGE